MAWSQEQWNNAAVIYQVGQQMGMSPRDIQIALITALTESGMQNLDYGDRDSLGMFQQRPSQGWGTAEQVTDPVYSSRKFFEALKGLGDKRYTMGMGEAAQAVQRSAYPDRYAEHLKEVRFNWPQVQTKAGVTPLDPDGQPVQSTQPMVYTPPTVQAPVDNTYLGANVNMDLEASSGGVLGADGASSLAAPMQSTTGQEFSNVMPVIGAGTSNYLNQVQEQAVGTPYTKGVNGWRKAVISYAREALGTPYVWGGTNLGSGVDCSGLIQAIFSKAGYDLPRISFQQANYGKHVGIDALRPGDLVAWDNSSRNSGADHIALYIGNGQIIEAPRTGLSVRIRDIGSDEGAYGVHLKL